MANAVSSFSVPNGCGCVRAARTVPSGSGVIAVRQRKNHKRQRDAYTEKAHASASSTRRPGRQAGNLPPASAARRLSHKVARAAQNLQNPAAKEARIRQATYACKCGIGKKRSQRRTRHPDSSDPPDGPTKPLDFYQANGLIQYHKRQAPPPPAETKSQRPPSLTPENCHSSAMPTMVLFIFNLANH